MRYIIEEREEIDNDTPYLNGTWYYVVPKSRILKWWWSYCGNYYVFKTIDKAEKCRQLLESKRWKYTKSVKEVVV